ncbi:MAG: glycosyltransferase family 4 protein [Clostridia bacterium]|nr:glycosyltransferase family 4 protein [Clostridia bacterium]
MKNIAFFINDIYSCGGTEKVVSLIANALSKWYNITIFSLYKSAEEPAFKINSNVRIIPIFDHKFKNYRLLLPFFRWKIAKEIKKYVIDSFIVAGMKYVPFTYGLLKNVQYIAWDHNNTFSSAVCTRTWFGRVISSKYADKIVVLTDKDRQENIKRFKTNPSKIIRIYNPIEFIKEDNSNYDISSKMLLSSGRICHQKGFDMLVEVASLVFKKHPDWKWHIYGDGADKEKIQNLIDNASLNNNVILMGKTNKMNELYKEYAMFIMTSRYEGFAMVNIEAHYAKLPIVSFDCNCGPDEIIQDGINGYLIDCFNIDKMAEKINYLIEHEEIRKQMSDNTMMDKEKLQPETIINEWKEILR